MRKILITGGTGLLAHALGQTKPDDVDIIFMGHAEFDLTQPELMSRQLAEMGERVVRFYEMTKQPEKARAWREKLGQKDQPKAKSNP